MKKKSFLLTMPSASGDTCLVQSCSSSMTYLYSTRAWGWEGGSRREKEKSERKKKKRKTPKKKLEEENSEIFMKKWKNDNAPREASRALQSTRPQGTTPSARARSRGRTSQKGSATRRCRAFGGCIESVGEFFLLEGERTRTAEKRKKEKKGKKAPAAPDRGRRSRWSPINRGSKTTISPLCPFLTCGRGTRRSASRARCALRTRRSWTRPRRRRSGPRSRGPSASKRAATAAAGRGRRGPLPSSRRRATPSCCPWERKKVLRC